MVRSAKQKNDVPFRFVHSNTNEIGFIEDDVVLDMDIGKSNDFKMTVGYASWSKQPYDYDDSIFIPGTEFGGIISNVESASKTQQVILTGDTWRGMLSKKVVVPPSGQENLVLNGELNTVIRSLIGNRFGSLFIVPEVSTDVTVSKWKVDRYVTLLDALNKLLLNYKCKLKIKAVEQNIQEDFHVEITAEHIADYSNEIEYSGKQFADLNVKDYRGGINHLVCVGEGEGNQRVVKHLYVQQNGSISEKPFYTGLAEKEAVYNYSGADAVKLVEDGTKRLKELMNSKQVKATARDIDVDINDVISGYDIITDTRVDVPIIGKILKISNGEIKIEHETKGEN